MGTFAQNEDMLSTPLTLEAIEAGTITFNNQAEGPVTYRVNDGELQTIESKTEGKIAVEAGDKVAFFGDNDRYTTDTTRISEKNTQIKSSHQCYMYGNIMSLVNSSTFAQEKKLVRNYTFFGLFYSNHKLDIHPSHQLLFPATRLSEGCYSKMFLACSLTKAPELPATELALGCYYGMFEDCTELTVAPALPATMLKSYCYGRMFAGCFNLKEAPELPATTLAEFCYDKMFRMCPKLTKAPVLPATTLAANCYSNMFYGCTGLTEAPALPATTLASNCYSNMFRGCAGLTKAPELPATTQAANCYQTMFYGCTGLTEAPALPATTLASNCYSGMFSHCINLRSVTCLATDISANECTNEWLKSVAPIGTFTKAAGEEWPTGVDGIPEGWTIVDYDPTGINSTTTGSPMLKDGNSWRYIKKVPDWNVVDTVVSNTIECELVVAGDTIADDHQCKKIYYREEGVNRLVCIAYTIEGKVYAKSLVPELFGMEMNNYDNWALLYDFDAKEGTRMAIGGSLRQCTLYLIGNFTINGELQRCQVWETESGKYQVVVENIGCEEGLYWFENMANNGVSTVFTGFYQDGRCIFPLDSFREIMPSPDYRPFVEDGKVWKVGYGSDNPVQRVEYYYFDGDTIIGGKVCKQMMRQRYVTPDYADYDVIKQLPLLSPVSVWYEADMKVYAYDSASQQFQLMYDFSANDDDTLTINNQLYAIGPRLTGGLKGFKGVYREVGNHMSWWNGTWLEGVGSIEGPIFNVYYGKEYHGGAFLMSCTVGDEVIYLNDEFEDGTDSIAAGARKSRFDFTHIAKPRPKAPKKVIADSQRDDAMQSLYGEYNNQQLSIRLDPLDEAYLVRITDSSDKVLYEKAVNAGNIIGINIDISAYAKGRYTVTVENSRESFIGQFEAQTTGIVAVKGKGMEARGGIYNLQGQRVRTLQKGLNVVNGKKVIVHI
jgi:hypothetical protein